jgi:hypothetical protein
VHDDDSLFPGQKKKAWQAPRLVETANRRDLRRDLLAPRTPRIPRAPRDESRSGFNVLESIMASAAIQTAKWILDAVHSRIEQRNVKYV